MQNRISNLWTLGGLSIWELCRRTARESWRDDVFGQGGRMAFYQFLTIFPSLLVLFTIRARVPHLAYVTHALRDLSVQLFPEEVSQLFQTITSDLNRHVRFGLGLLSVFAGATWAAHNGTWAMIYGLNRAYEVDERRSWWRLTVTIVGLTLCLMLTGLLGIAVMLCGTSLAAHLHGSMIVGRVVEWLVLLVSLCFAFVVLYRFAPNLHEHQWRRCTPGALCALILWIAAIFAARAYFDHVNNYSRSYGFLNGVVVLLLWLYATNGAILIGGEMNSEIAKALEQR